MSDYTTVRALHAALPPFSPIAPVALLPYLATLLLASTFGLAFYFSTLPKSTIPILETAVASTASILAGFGVVALFCSVGVYV
ncbi:putative oligosaccharyltransferase subunit 5 [Lyophyllum shimeji]|uniref:Dolichyl-diphosphooligosaccharide-protein glycosyltransferase subunit OST5 n=1 Tax=Lyophyllum shimeji TaxID=47721 RepID=A0A9P3UMU9_LYOSH|nr:putative oligosaccharyltransferase subunit 5 [Lyophyllum shimeji]